MSNKSATQNGGRPPSKLTAIQRYLDNSKDSCSQAASSLQPAERNRDMEASNRNTAGNKRSLSNNLSDAASLKHTKRVKMETDRMDANSLETLPQQRKFLCNLKLDDMSRTKCSYLEHLRELFFLQNGGNLMDYMNWKKRPNPQLADFIKSSQLDSDDECIEDMHTKSDNEETKYETKDTEKHTSSTSALRVSIASRDSESSASSRSVATNIASDGHGTHQSTSNSSSGRTTSAHISTIAQRSPMSPPRQGTRQHALSAVYEGTMGSQEAIVERAKQEAQVMQRVASLRKEGLWSSRRLPKVQEPPRLKAHWDYLLEEMQWLAADFAQERKWKKAGARKIARMVYKYHQDLQQKELKAEKEEGLKLKRIAGQMARIVREFWNNIERVVQYKQSSRLEEKRKKALDIHLSFIVDQTEKYSSWLTEGLKTNSSQGSSVTGSVTSGRDDDFEPSSSDSSDDEETIAKEEAEAAKSKDNVVEEIEDLKKQSEMPIEELLKTLPPEVLKKPAEVSSNKGDDSDFSCADESDSDIGDTIEEQEKHEKNIDHRVEIDELKKEGELSIEELRKKYSTPCGSKVTSEGDDSDTSDVSESSGDTTEESDSEESEDFGTELLVDNETSQDNSTSKTSIEGPEGINDIAATAMSLQPTGYTLETTQVKVQAPFLLKHTLREYQLIGLNWMSTMHDRKLNGILADEMGLGKTIQTIALLAHLATSHGVWGPHLIVVPTSVMLNWEMELKKWCPAFKILTYYGSQKERKQKRMGWTKTNAFHVCITSYKLVIQDHQAFRRKKWRYFILDEAQNIKNFRSQRWQTLLNFSSQRRLLLTGTPLQNSLMELWSLMHFLMPHVFQSHREFKEWFANPLTGMIEGSREYNESLIRRLHKVLRPFLLRRLKNDVEKQMPQKYEHVVMCRLSKRQRFLYDDFMSRTKTKETLESGHYMSVINILMQLRKVCNHPNLFDPRPIVSPFQMEGISYHTASIVLKALDKDPLDCATCISGHDTLVNREFQLPRSAAHRVSQLRFTRDMIVEIETEHEDEDSAALLPPVSDKERSLVNKACAESAHVQARGVFQSMRQSALLAGKVNGYDEYITIDDRQQVAPQNPRVEPVSANTLLSVPETFSRSVQPVCDPSSKFYVTALAKKRAQRRADKLTRLCRMNAWRCTDSFPVYGSDLCNAVDVMSDASPRAYPANASFCTKTAGSVSGAKWNATGYVNCLLAQMPLGLNATPHWKHTDALAHLINKPEEHLHSQKSVLDRYTFVIPPVMAPCISMHTSHPDPSVFNLERSREYMLHDHLSPKTNCLHSISTNMTVQFPELRLIQYDCGKLQTLDILLRRLKSGDHRVLIFTQMTKMLNVLEGFLNFHGHRYLRLDGTTRVEQRQALMERFNIDKRIFVFILSTRSGGIGVNLTGADTVIFYDSDWNPTMDAQAQDRCHRIGQTRDVHIYRLISEKTIEENILKKANQKRLLGDVAIEGGNFTTAFFKQQTIKDLFEEPSGLEAFAKEQNEKKKDDLLDAQMEDVKSEDKTEKEENKDGTTTMSQDQIEQALGNAEDETDVISAKVVKAEQKAELAEFDENIPWDEKEAELRKNQEVSKVEMELAMIDKELTPVERYAVNFMETSTAHEAHEELEAAEEEVTIAKEEWQLSRLKELKEEEELRAELEEDDMLFTYTQDDISSKVFVCDTTGKEMPLWTPPTPPQDDNDVYMDPSLCFMYETTIMMEAQLPAIYIKKEVRRLHCPTQSATPRKRAKVDEQTRVPKSLFDRANMIKRDAKLVKMRPGLNKPVKAGQGGMEVASPDIHYPEWLIHEDWALLQAVQMVQELPLSLYTNSTGHIINWDLVSHIVNATSRTYRSIKHCKLRYENVLVAREEGKILYDVNPRKPKKTKAIYKTKNNRPMRTSQLYVQDSGARVSTMYTMRFDYTKHLASKRQPAVRQSASLSQKFDKHLSVLSDHRVNYNSPQTPVQVAAIRADRVARDKNSAAEAANHRQQKLHAAAQQAAVQQAAQQAAAVQQQQQVAAQVVHQAQQQAAVAQAQQQVQQATAQQQQQQQQHITGVAVTSAVTGQMAVVHTAATNAQAVLSQAVLQKAVAGQVGNAQGGTVTAFAQLPDSRSIVVNTALTNAPFSSINKRVAAVNASSGVMTATTLSAVSGVSTVSAATRARAPHGTIQEVSVNTPPGTAGIATTQVRAVNAQTAQILTQAQLVAQKAANITTQGGLQHHQQIQRALTGTSGHQLILKQDTSGLKKQATIRQQPQHRFTTSEAVRQQQQLRRFTTGAHQQATITAAIQQSVAGQQQATLQKAVSVTTPMIQQGTRLAVPGKQQMMQKPTEVSAQLLKRQQIRQMNRQLSPAIFASNQLQVATTQQGGTLTAVGAVGGSAQGGVSAGGISGGSVSVCTPQSIATVVKATLPSGVTVTMSPSPNVTIPVTAVSVQRHPGTQHKSQAQMSQIRLAQLARSGNLKTQQKVSMSLPLAQVKGALQTGPVIIQQHPGGGQTQRQPVTVQQIQQIVRQQQQSQLSAASTQQQQQQQPQGTTVLLTQPAIGAATHTQHTLAKVTLPTASVGAIGTSVTGAIRAGTPVSVTATSLCGMVKPALSSTQGVVSASPLVKQMSDVVQLSAAKPPGTLTQAANVTPLTVSAQQQLKQQSHLVRQVISTAGGGSIGATATPTVGGAPGTAGGAVAAGAGVTPASITHLLSTPGGVCSSNLAQVITTGGVSITPQPSNITVKLPQAAQQPQQATPINVQHAVQQVQQQAQQQRQIITATPATSDNNVTTAAAVAQAMQQQAVRQQQQQQATVVTSEIANVQQQPQQRTVTVSAAASVASVLGQQAVAAGGVAAAAMGAGVQQPNVTTVHIQPGQVQTAAASQQASNLQQQAAQQQLQQTPKSQQNLGMRLRTPNTK